MDIKPFHMRTRALASPSDDLTAVELVTVSALMWALTSCSIDASAAPPASQATPRSGIEVADSRGSLSEGHLGASVPTDATDGSGRSDGSGGAGGSMTRRLAAPDFGVRQRAMWELWGDRERTRDWVQRAAREAEPEVAARAERILQLWARGILPETPPHVARRVESVDVARAAEELLEAGEFDAAVVAVDESLGTIDRENVQSRVSRALTVRFPIYARMAFERDAVEGLLRLVDIAADSKELAACRLEMMRWLGEPVDDDSRLPESSLTWERTERDEATALTLFLAGRPDDAVDYVRGTAADDRELLHAARMLAGRWDEIASESARVARRSPGGSPEQARAWSHTLVAADRAGRDDLRAEAIAALADDRAASDPGSVGLRWQSLAVHGEVDAACRLLARDQPEAAAEIAISAVRPDQAFEQLEIAPVEIETELTRWLEEAMRAQRASDDETPVAEVRRLLALMKCLISVGRLDLAWRIAEGMSSANVAVGRVELRAYVLTSLPATIRRDWVQKLSVLPDEATLSTAAENMLVRVLNDTDAATFGLLIDATEAMMPRASLRERVDAVATLLDGEIPPGFNPKTGFRFLFHYRPDDRGRTLERLGGRILSRPRQQPPIGMASFFARHGQTEFARHCLRELHDAGDAEATFELAELALRSGAASDARDLFDQIWKSYAEGRARRGGMSGTSLAAKAIAGIWVADKRIGDHAAAERGERLVRLMLTSPSSETRLDLLRYLAEQGERQIVADGFDALLPITALGSPDGTAFYTAAYTFAVDVAEQRPGEAARWFDLAFSGTLESTFFLPAAYVSLPLITHRWRLQAAVRRGDEEKVRQSFDRILRLDPLDIRFAEDLLPEVRDAGMDELANRTLDRILDAGLRYCRRYRFDATTANNLAWVAAVNGRRLDDALWLSELAVTRHPESAIYRDTLAEILFRMGRVREAIEIEKACLIDDPGQWHLHEQLARFRQKADRGPSGDR